MKSHSLKTLAALSLTLLLLSQFNNCGNYAEPNVSELSSSSVSCTTADCISPKLENLAVVPHLRSTGDFGVPPTMGEFNIAGACNEGGYPSNQVRWELRLGGVVKRSSSNAMAGLPNANSRCINGRFLIYVNLRSIAADPFDRIGLSNGAGQRVSYDLWVEIYGLTQVGAVNDPSIRYQTRVPLSAL